MIIRKSKRFNQFKIVLESDRYVFFPKYTHVTSSRSSKWEIIVCRIISISRLKFNTFRSRLWSGTSVLGNAVSILRSCVSVRVSWWWILEIKERKIILRALFDNFKIIIKIEGRLYKKVNIGKFSNIWPRINTNFLGIYLLFLYRQELIVITYKNFIY